MVGTTGFEPATSRTPSVRATRLRYVPTGERNRLFSVSLAFEKGQDGEQFFVQIEQKFAMRARTPASAAVGASISVRPFERCDQRSHAPPARPFRFGQMLARAGDRKALVVEQALDLENRLDIFAAIQPMPLGLFTGCSMGNSVSQ